MSTVSKKIRVRPVDCRCAPCSRDPQKHNIIPMWLNKEHREGRPVFDGFGTTFNIKMAALMCIKDRVDFGNKN